MPARRIILLAVMILSTLGFLIDRVFLGEPSPASAEQPPPPAARSSSPARSAKGSEAPPVERATTIDPSLAWLNKLETSSPSPRNVFAPSAELLAFLDAQFPDRSESDAEQEKAEGEKDSARFEAEHTLQATFLGDEKMMAMIDGKVVHVGSVLDGYTIAHIESHRVECLREDQRAILRMNVPLR